MFDFAKHKKDQEVDFLENENEIDDSLLDDINFSEAAGGGFKKSFPKVKQSIKLAEKKRALKPLDQEIPVRKHATVNGDRVRKLGKVIVPRDRKLIVEGQSDVNKYILSDEIDDVKRINYHNGNRLKELVLTFSNDSAMDFDLELFNPSMPLDYLYSTALNVNDQIIVAAETSGVRYTDVCFNILANPMYIYNAKIIIAGTQSSAQLSQPLTFVNKNSEAFTRTNPKLTSLLVDNFQVQNTNVNFFNISKQLGRPYIADGMDIIQYRVLAGSTVTIAWYYKQKQIKRIYYNEETKGNKLLL